MTPTKKTQKKSINTTPGVKNSTSKPKISKQAKAVTEFLAKDRSRAGTLFDHELKLVPKQLIITRKQVRSEFDEESIQGLADSIKSIGLIQPIEVYEENGKYVVLTGERRFRAVTLLDWDRIPAFIKNPPEDSNKILIQLIENIQRSDTSPIDSSIALNKFQQLQKCTQDVIAKKLGKSITWVCKTMDYSTLLTKVAHAQYLNSLPRRVLDELVIIINEPFFDEIIKKVQEGKINSTNIRAEIEAEKLKFLKEKDKLERDEKNIKHIFSKLEKSVHTIEKEVIKLRYRHSGDAHQSLLSSLEKQLNKTAITINNMIKQVNLELNQNYSLVGSMELKSNNDQNVNSENSDDTNSNDFGNTSTSTTSKEVDNKDISLASNINVDNQKKTKKNIHKETTTNKSNGKKKTLKEINYSTISPEISIDKEALIEFIMDRIDIQESVLRNTPMAVLIDQWHALKFSNDKKEILSVADWYYKAITEKWKLPKELLLVKKDVGGRSNYKYNTLETTEEDALMAYSTKNEKIAHMEKYISDIDNASVGLDDIEDFKRHRYYEYQGEIRELQN